MQKYTYNRATGRLVAKAGMVRPEMTDSSKYDFPHGWDIEEYRKDLAAYEAHLSTLPPDIIVSDEFKEVYKDKPEDWEYEEGKDFEQRAIEPRPGDWDGEYMYAAYPIVKAEQEDQEKLWKEAFLFIDLRILMKHFTIQRIKK